MIIRTYCVVFKVPTLRKFLKIITSKLKSFVGNYFLRNTILQKYLLTLVNNAKGLRIFKIINKNKFGIIIYYQQISLLGFWSRVVMELGA